MSGQEATALLKDRVAHWPDEARRAWEDGLDSMELRGMAMRSYQQRGQDSAIEIALTEFSSAGDAESRHRGNARARGR
ncbi:hypothetical protein [Streptomyces sp. ST2-7A]|uniref:hypothetical protein n=1 Tax=Streptomyces sp. ST2-7A TaxID=2907214 RepID=UPI001F2E10A9|nr:hypothetical protein [Streptomyces sp. ST2-7A]MCE7080250.1 hypothetical protein [Streptomyces sp. ST2-7A]